MGALALPLMLAGVGIQVAGTVAAARGERYAGEAEAAQAQSQAALAQYNAQLQERQAQAIEQKTTYEQQKQAEEAARRMSALQAGLGGAGVVTTAGTPLLIAAKQTSEDELSNLMIGYEGRIQAGQARSATEMERYQSRMYQQQAKYAKQAGRMRAGTTLLTGFGRAGTMLGGALYSPTPKTTSYSPELYKAGAASQLWLAGY
jgi:hypothetical protein